MMPIPTALRDKLLRKLDMRAIAAMAENGVIGAENAIPWQLPREMAFFRKMTEGASVLMGRRTFESIGHPLPNRRNIVITGDPSWRHGGVTVIDNFDRLLHIGIESTLWVCGGAMVYGALLPACRELYLSVVAIECRGDVKFPEIGDLFVKDKTIFTCPDFRIEHYVSERLLKK
jgi:dihydrofolate reductase